jgi:hypothetical protein
MLDAARIITPAGLMDFTVIKTHVALLFEGVTSLIQADL